MYRILSTLVDLTLIVVTLGVTLAHTILCKIDHINNNNVFNRLGQM